MQSVKEIIYNDRCEISKKMFTKVRLVVSNDRRAFLRTATVRESVPRQVDRESRVKVSQSRPTL